MRVPPQVAAFQTIVRKKCDLVQKSESGITCT